MDYKQQIKEAQKAYKKICYIVTDIPAGTETPEQAKEYANACKLLYMAYDRAQWEAKSNGWGVRYARLYEYWYDVHKIWTKGN